MANYESNSPTSQPSLFSQVSGVQGMEPSVPYSNLSGEGSRAGIHCPGPPETALSVGESPRSATTRAVGGQCEFGVASEVPVLLPDICRTRHGGNAQSEAANAKVAPAKKGMRVAILAALAASDGLTLKELASKFNKQLNQISGRVTELLADQLIERTSIVRDGCAVLRAKGTNA